jgi:hypothetical protein
MRTLLPLFTFLLLGQFVIGQGCTELFISEYLEGNGNNKGFEIYNPTANPIDLGPYVLERWSNGANAVSDAIDLQGTIAAYGTWVVVNGQTEDVDISGGSISPAVDVEMQILADQLDNPYPAPTYMNGDDALVFMKNGTEIIDIFGKPGEDPGAAWTDNEAAGYTSEDGGTYLTANHTVRRKIDITIGVTTAPVVFNTLLEWDTLPNQTWDGLGSHTCNCDPGVGLTENTPVEVSVSPNPVQNNNFTVTASRLINRVEMFDQTGRMVKNEAFGELSQNAVISTAGMESGIYFVNVYMTGKTTFTQRVVVR